MSFNELMNRAIQDHETSSGPLPEGDYVAVLAKAETQPNNMGEPRTTLEFHITTEGYSNRRVWENIKHGDSTLWKAGLIFNGMGLSHSISGWHEWAETMRVFSDRELDNDLLSERAVKTAVTFGPERFAESLHRCILEAGHLSYKDPGQSKRLRVI